MKHEIKGLFAILFIALPWYCAYLCEMSILNRFGRTGPIERRINSMERI